MENKKEQIENKRAKIIVSSEDELTDLLRKISGLTDPNILLTFAEESDLLISPINLKVLQEVCDDLDKNLVLQIIQNSNGVRNAKIADSVITESPSEIDESLWLAAENGRRERKEKLSEALKGKPKEVRETVVELEQEIEPVLQDSEYQKRVQEVIEKAKNLTEKEKSQIIHEEGLTFAIGEEIAPEEQKKDFNEKNNLIGRNFNNIAQLKGLRGDIDKSIPEDKKKEQKIKPAKDKKKIKKKILIFSIILILSLALAGVFAYLTLPLVQTEIYIESKAIEVEKFLKGDTKIENFDISKGDLPIRKETVNVDRSDHDKTTGTGKRGTKAEGIVELFYWDREGEEIVIPSGTKISTDNINFEITKSVEIKPGGPFTVPVRATEPGSEYNLSAGQMFSVGALGEDVSASNLAAFSGGASEEYLMLTQADYTKLLERLKKEAFEDGISQLKELNPEWELIESTIDQDIDGNITTDIPIGGEADLFNMSIATKTEALFFNKNEIIQSREEIIKRAAVEKKLFETDGDLRLELDQEIETEITIEEIEGNTVTVKFWAKGNVRPQINTEEIQKSLLGKSWDEGMKILEKIKYSDKKASVNFFPEYFPEFLRHFPSKEGRVIVETKLIETEVVTESEEDLEVEEEIEEVEEE